MEPQRGVVLAHTIHDLDVVALLEADAVAVVPADRAARDRGAVRSVQEDPRPATAIQGMFSSRPPSIVRSSTRAPSASYPLITGKTVAAWAPFSTMQSAISGRLIETVAPFRPVIRATVV